MYTDEQMMNWLESKLRGTNKKVSVDTTTGVEIIHTNHHGSRYSFRKAITDAMDADGYMMAGDSHLLSYMVFYTSGGGKSRTKVISAKNLNHAEWIAKNNDSDIIPDNILLIKPV